MTMIKFLNAHCTPYIVGASTRRTGDCHSDAFERADSCAGVPGMREYARHTTGWSIDIGSDFQRHTSCIGSMDNTIYNVNHIGVETVLMKLYAQTAFDDMDIDDIMFTILNLGKKRN